MTYRRKDTTIQSLYAELLDRLLAANVFTQPEFGYGSLICKTVGAQKYWYFQPGQRNEQGRQSHRYIGPASDPDVQSRVRQASHELEQLKGRKRLVAMLKREGFKSPLPALGEVLAAMANAGHFQTGACLVGTLAYQAYEPILGVGFAKNSMQTMDVDVAHALRCSLPLGSRPFPELLAALDDSFRPVPGLRPGHDTGSYINSAGLRVDVLAPEVGKPSGKPLVIPGLGSPAQPLRYLDFLIEDHIPAAILHGKGVLVNIPSPERYAVHKMLIHRDRALTFPVKSRKDLEQAQNLIEVLIESNRLALLEILREAENRGPKWRSNLAFGLAKLPAPLRTAIE